MTQTMRERPCSSEGVCDEGKKVLLEGSTVVSGDEVRE